MVGSLLVDRIWVTAPGAGLHVITQHDLDIPEGYLIDIHGAEIVSNGFLDTGGVLQAFLSLDEDVQTRLTGRESDDVIFATAFETLLVTTGGGMIVAADRVMFPKPIATAHDIISWILYSVTDWSASEVSMALYYELRKATPKDITNLLLRRR